MACADPRWWPPGCAVAAQLLAIGTAVPVAARAAQENLVRFGAERMLPVVVAPAFRASRTGQPWPPSSRSIPHLEADPLARRARSMAFDYFSDCGISSMCAGRQSAAKRYTSPGPQRVCLPFPASYTPVSHSPPQMSSLPSARNVRPPWQSPKT
jgi:hypothetical protein